MTVLKIFHGDSCCGSGSTIDIIHNDENDLFAVIVTDETGYRDLITLDRETIFKLCEKVTS